MNILYIEDEIEIAEIYITIIKSHFNNTKIVRFENGLKAIQELSSNPAKYDLIISDFELPQANGGEIFKFVNSQMLGIPFIVISAFDCLREENFKNFFNSHVKNAMILKPATANEIVSKIEWCLESETNLLKIYQNSAQNCDEKVPVRSDNFLKTNSTNCNVYLKLKDEKFIKVINKNEIFETKLIEKLILKGVAHFYVNRSEISEYSDSTLNNLQTILKTKKIKADDVQKCQVTDKAIEVLKGNLLKCGFSPMVLSVTDEICKIQIEMMEETEHLMDFLTKFQYFRKMNTEHTRLVSYIIVGILKELNWDSETTLQRMCTAALVHDISLPDEFINKVILSDEKGVLRGERERIYVQHPVESSHIAKNFGTIAPGIEQYIVEHHELPDGSGFPKKLNHANVHPLSASLHLADITSSLIWKTEFDIAQVKSELELMKPLYLKGFYRKPYEALMISMQKCGNG